MGAVERDCKRPDRPTGLENIEVMSKSEKRCNFGKEGAEVVIGCSDSLDFSSFFSSAVSQPKRETCPPRFLSQSGTSDDPFAARLVTPQVPSSFSCLFLLPIPIHLPRNSGFKRRHHLHAVTRNPTDNDNDSINDQLASWNSAN